MQRNEWGLGMDLGSKFIQEFYTGCEYQEENSMDSNSTTDFSSNSKNSQDSGQPYYRSCELCGLGFNVYFMYSAHMLKEHKTSDNSFKCPFCPYVVKHKSHMVRHVRGHTGEKPFFCRYCPYRSSQNYHIVRHMKSTHPNINEEVFLDSNASE